MSVVERKMKECAVPTGVLSEHAELRVDELTRSVMGAIVRKTDRDAQKSIGPSEIGNPCDYCVGRALCRRFPEYWPGADAPDDHFSLKAWMGTAVHEKLERDLELEGARKEATVSIGELEGYGPISGHVDLIWGGVVMDYKTIDRSRLDLVQLNGPPKAYVRQINLYARGVQNTFQEQVHAVCLLFIPRDSNRVGDAVRVASPYRTSIAEQAWERLERLWSLVRAGHGPSLPHDGECYRCTVRQWS